jgi:glycosyltransferase involved in cell wall biosynthesis
LKAFAILRNRIDARLVIMGEGALRDSLLQLATDLGISADVHFMGFVSDPLPVMAEAAVFVHSARYEGFVVVLLEALACRCPIVATDCPGGIRDVLAEGKYGALVAVGDATAIADAMESVLRGNLSFPDPTEHLKTFELDRVAEAYISLLLPREPASAHDER